MKKLIAWFAAAIGFVLGAWWHSLYPKGNDNDE